MQNGRSSAIVIFLTCFGAVAISPIAQAANVQGEITGIVQSTDMTVRCNDDQGYVQTGGYTASASDVQLDQQGPIDCDNQQQCKGWEVRVHRNSQDPFDLQVWASCSGS